MNAYMSAYMYEFIHERIHVWMHACAFSHAYSYIYTRAFMYQYIYLYLHTCAGMYSHIYVYKYVCTAFVHDSSLRAEDDCEELWAYMCAECRGHPFVLHVCIPIGQAWFFLKALYESMRRDQCFHLNIPCLRLLLGALRFT